MAEEKAAKEEKKRSIYGPMYRQRYRCDDWLAFELAGQFSFVNEKCELQFDHKEIEKMLKENGVKLVGKWAELPKSGQHGWVGRYRMNGRQKLEIGVARNGVLRLIGDIKKAPKEWLDEMREKHDKVLPVEKGEGENGRRSHTETGLANAPGRA